MRYIKGIGKNYGQGRDNPGDDQTTVLRSRLSGADG